MSSNKEIGVDKETAKEQFRSSRLSWSNQAEHKLRQELNEIAIANCREFIAQFGECAQANGLMVVFRCREQNKAMNACLHQYTNDQAFTAYKQKREDEMITKL